MALGNENPSWDMAAETTRSWPCWERSEEPQGWAPLLTSCPGVICCDIIRDNVILLHDSQSVDTQSRTYDECPACSGCPADAGDGGRAWRWNHREKRLTLTVIYYSGRGLSSYQDTCPERQQHGDKRSFCCCEADSCQMLSWGRTQVTDEAAEVADLSFHGAENVSCSTWDTILVLVLNIVSDGNDSCVPEWESLLLSSEALNCHSRGAGWGILKQYFIKTRFYE